MKKKWTGVIFLALVMAMTASCGKNKEKTIGAENYSDSIVTEAGELPLVKDKITLNLGVRDYKYVQDYETNEYTKWLEEQTNIDLDFTLFPTSNHMEKFRLLVASDSKLPDIMINFGFSKIDILKFGKDGVITDLKDMIDNEGYYVNKMFEEAREPEFLRKSMTSFDGAMYYMPYYIEQVGNEYGRKAFINKKWLDKLGLEVPQTTEDLKNVLKAFKENDPNGNGKADEIGFTGSKNGWNESVVPFLMNSFIYDDTQNRVQVKDGKVSAIFNTDEWRNGLRYIHSLAEEGLFDVQSFTQDSSTLKTLAQNPECSILGAFASGSPDSLFAVGDARLGEYVALPPLKGPDGVAYAIKEAGGANDGGMITKDCTNKLAAFRLMDFMLSEESALRSRYGVPGVDWTEAQEGDECMFKDLGVKPRVRSILPYMSVQNSHWYAQNPQFRNYEIANGIVWDGNELDGEYFKAKALDAYINKEPKERLRGFSLSEEMYDEYTTIYSEIRSYISECTSMFIIGKMDIESEWDKYIETLNSLGVDRYVEILQEGYDNFNKE